MKNIRRILVLTALFLLPVFFTGLYAQVGKQPIVGHWDLTVDMGNNQSVPSWLEVKLSGFKTFVGYFVADAGSARPISIVKVEGQKVSFNIPPQWEAGTNDLYFDGTLNNDKISGTITTPDGKKHSFNGEKAPTLVRDKETVWNEPVKLF